MVTICWLCRNGSRLPPVWWGYSALDWAHVQSPTADWEKQQPTPSSITKIKCLQWSWVSRAHTWAPWTGHQDNVLSAALSSSHRAGAAHRLPGAEVVLCHSLCEGMHLFVHSACSSSPCHQSPGSQQGREAPQLPACSHRSSLSLGKYLNKVCSGR